MRRLFLFLVLLQQYCGAGAQQPQYTPKLLVTTNSLVSGKSTSSLSSTCFVADITIFDTDDSNTIPIKIFGPYYICIMGSVNRNKKEGLFTTYVFDKKDTTRRYKIWEQHYRNNRLNGLWKVFNLKGTLISSQTFKEDSLNGVATEYSIDGKRVVSERIYAGSRSDYQSKEYYPNGRIASEAEVQGGKLNGVSRQYYENGNLKETASFAADSYDGLRRYYHPNGQLWVETIFCEGKYWEAVSNYTFEGLPRDPGTLKGGNGTIIYYSEDNSIREIAYVINGFKVD